MRSLLTAVLLLLISGCGKPDQPTVNLYLAVQRGDIDQIERHIAWGSDINGLDADGHRPLHVAAAQGRYVIVKLLLKHGAERDAGDRDGNTALHHALLAGRTQVAEYLVRQGAPLEADRMLERVIAHDTADRDVIAFLVSRGANLNRHFESGYSPLATAVNRDLRRMAKWLIAAGADVNQPTREGKTPLDLALERGNRNIIRILQRNGAVAGVKP